MAHNQTQTHAAFSVKNIRDYKHVCNQRNMCTQFRKEICRRADACLYHCCRLWMKEVSLGEKSQTSNNCIVSLYPPLTAQNTQRSTRTKPEASRGRPQPTRAKGPLVTSPHLTSPHTSSIPLTGQHHISPTLLGPRVLSFCRG